MTHSFRFLILSFLKDFRSLSRTCILFVIADDGFCVNKISELYEYYIVQEVFMDVENDPIYAIED
ncbi:MAG: hypothetical protein D3926_09650 [Desulfobacteraceae bacterium]|nr:MAG: hypothetical protein D3926_09650 [Desulfobacteraceae bacterium]